MNKPKFFYAILEIGGVVIFVAAVFLTIFFAEGYRYDFSKNELVKKGVVYFEGISEKDAMLSLDGKPMEVSFPVGLEVLPGYHEIQIYKTGFFTWAKSINVNADQLVRFPKIKLLPATDGAGASTGVYLEPMRDFSVSSFSTAGVLLFNEKLHFWKRYLLNKKARFDIGDTVVSSAVFDVFRLSDSKGVIGRMSNNRVFFYDEKNYKMSFIDAVSAVQLKSPDSAVIFALTPEGTVYSIQENLLPIEEKFSVSQFLQLSESPILEIKRVQRQGKYYLFILKDSKGEFLLVVDDDGKIVFRDDGITSGFLDIDNKVYFVRDSLLFCYDLEGKDFIFTSDRPMEMRAIWMSRVGTTFHFLFLSSDSELFFCDEDAQNCHLIAKMDYGFIQSSENQTIFFGIERGLFVLFDFGDDLPFPEKLFQDFVP